MTKMKVVCAWCGEGIGEKDGKGQTGISHGICKQCAEKELAETEKRYNVSATDRSTTRSPPSAGGVTA